MKKNNHILWIVYITTLLINCSIISGQEANNLQYDKAGHIKYIRFGESKTIGSWNIPSSSNEFFKNIMKVEDPNKFILKTKLEHKNGSYCEIYNQSFNDIKVEDGIFSLQFKNGKMVKANGHIVNLSGLSTTPALSPEEASKIYAKYLYASDTVKIKFLYGIVISETMKVSDKDTT